MELSVAERLKALRDRFDLTQEELAKELVSDRSYLSLIENGKKTPGPKFLARLETVEKEGVYKGRGSSSENSVLRERPIPLTYIPRLSWVHAGTLTSFDELPKDWQDMVPNTSNDPKAFALAVRGDCMSPKYASNGDDVIVTPSAELANGCLVAARLHDGSVLFRQYVLLQANGKKFKLVCSNKDLGEPDLEVTWKDLAWMYRVKGALRNFD